jgi:GR25 family glycosyltransferase involved in LPS biosynthesis
MTKIIKKQPIYNNLRYIGLVILAILLIIWLGQKIFNQTIQIDTFESNKPPPGINSDTLPVYDPVIHTNIIIPYVEGGLGNQLYFISQAFIYAMRFGKTLFLKYETDLPSYGKPRPTYFTSIFRNIPVLKIDQAVLDKFSRVAETELDTDKHGNIYLTGGYFQKPTILKPYLTELRELFRPTPEIQSSISSIILNQEIQINRDIFLHIRLGDDWTPSDFGNVYTPDELDKIRQFIRTQLQQDPETKIILFSNNVDKALELLGQDRQITQAIQPIKYDEITEIYLLAQGRRFIASPSTFMIWGIMLSSQLDKEIKILWAPDSNDYRWDFYSQYKPLLTEKPDVPANHSVTCVSCFYNIGKSKYNTDAYTKWFASTLNIDANYVIFTDLASLELIKPYRQDQNTRYVIKPLDEFTIKAGMLDPKRHMHETHVPSLDVGLIWLNKLEMVKLASESNEFSSDWFMWIDAGLASLRDVKPGGPAFKFANLDFSKFSPAKLYYGQSEPNEIMSGIWEYKHNVQGGFFIIHKSSINKFFKLFQEYFANCIAQVNNYICLSEQVIWSHILKDKPAIFEKLCDGYGCIINVNNRVLSNPRPPIQESFQNNSSSSNNIHYYLINLAKNPERLAKFDTQAQKLGIKYTRFNAVYGKDLAQNDPRLVKYIAQPTSLNPGQVGCALSHLTLLEQIMTDPAISQDALICVFEDDVILPTDFVGKVSSFMAELNVLDSNWRFGLLGVLLCNGYKTANPGIIQAYPGQHNYGLHAYLVKKRSIKHILNYVSKNKVAVPVDDYYINNFYSAGSYIINPVLVKQDRTLVSDINVGLGIDDYTCKIKSR